MTLKDKTKGFWKRVSALDDDKETSKSESDEKNRIPYKDISKKLKDLMKQNVDVVGRRIIIPSYYAIYFSEADRKLRLEVEEVLCEELKEELYHEMRKINPEQNKRELLVKIETDPALEDGQFRIEYHINKPSEEAKPKQTAALAPPPEIESDTDFKQTVIEKIPSLTVDDEKTIVMPKAASDVLYTLLIDSGSEKREAKVTKKTITIGRGSKDDVTLESADFSISRSHTIISIREGHYYLMPAGINGTFLNGQELELNKEVEISSGDEIKIMNYSLRIL
jgi:hypothetical protein